MSRFVRKRRRVFRWRRRKRDAIVILALVCLFVFQLLNPSAPSSSFSFESTGPYRVERVVDGDTLLLEGRTRVRLIGVNTPETKHPTRPVEPLGPEASNFTRRHVEGREVTLGFDRERRDRYHRVLAYVFIDQWCLNEELIRAGFSRAETRYPYRAAMKKRFRAAQAEAQSAGRGLWAGQ